MSHTSSTIVEEVCDISFEVSWWALTESGRFDEAEAPPGPPSPPKFGLHGGIAGLLNLLAAANLGFDHLQAMPNTPVSDSGSHRNLTIQAGVGQR